MVILNYTVEAHHQIQLVRQLITIKNGFILGTKIGKHLIIKQMMPANFNKDTLSESYLHVFNQQGIGLLGVFFNYSKPFFDDWLIEDIIFIIDHNKELRLFTYDQDKEFKSIDYRM